MGFDDPADWRSDPTFQGATIGRYANRINRGTFELDGRRFHVPINDGAHAIHGGPGGFADHQWEVETDGRHAARIECDDAADQPRRGDGIPREPRRVSGFQRLRYRADGRLPRGDGRPDAGEPDQPRLPQPDGTAEFGRRAHHRAVRRPLRRGRPGHDLDRRDRRSGRHPAGLPQRHADREPLARRASADGAGRRLRPRLPAGLERRGSTTGCGSGPPSPSRRPAGASNCSPISRRCSSTAATC